MTREERLAAKLRENLRRRKAQARALGGTDAAGAEAAGAGAAGVDAAGERAAGPPGDSAPALSKSRTTR